LPLLGNSPKQDSIRFLTYPSACACSWTPTALPIARRSWPRS